MLLLAASGAQPFWRMANQFVPKGSPGLAETVGITPVCVK